MRRITMLLGAGILILCSMVFVLAPSIAEGAVPQLINFQGVLRDGSGNPVANGSYSVTFRIYDAPSAGNVLWSEVQSVTTNSGLFSIYLGSGPLPIADTTFNDSTRWLGIQVAGDPEMTPRQRMSSVGYSYVSSQWTSADSNLFRLNGKVGIGTSAPSAKLEVVTSDPSAISASGGNFGVSASGGLTGVYASAGSYGVYGTSGYIGGIFEGTGGGTYGVSASGGYIGGLFEGTGGGSYGVSASGGSYGVYGSGSTYGGQFTGTGGGSYGVSASGGTDGVYATGSTYGVYGTSGEKGVYGNGYGSSSSPIYGTLGAATNTSTGNAYGGYFYGSSTGGGYGYGIYASGGQNSIYAASSYGPAILAFGAPDAGYFIGNLIASGSKSAAVKTDNGEYRLLYAQESPENWFEDFGTAQLVSGRAVVNIDPTFAQTVNTTVEYHVFLTPKGDCRGLYVTNETPTSFEIRELQNGKSDLPVSYRIVAKRKGYENVRLAKLVGLNPEEAQAKDAKLRAEMAKENARHQEEQTRMEQEGKKMEAEHKQQEEQRAKMEQERLIQEQKVKEKK